MKKILFIFLCFVSVLALADEQLMVSPLLLLNPSHFLPPPPQEGSPLALKELSDIKKLNSESSDLQMEKAAQDAVIRDVTMFQKAIPGLNLEKMPHTKKLFEVVAYNEERVATVYKNYFQRKRPYQLDSGINTCVKSMDKKNFASYPSSHSAMAFSMGIVLTELFPNESENILRRAQHYAENRMICGVHHQTDIDAGQVLGSMIAAQLLMNPAFMEMVSKSREEIKGSGSLF